MAQSSNSDKFVLNLADSEYKNNLMSYKTEVLVVGSKKFELKVGDQKNYLIVASAKLRLDQIDMFDQSESHAMLQKTLAQIL